MIIVLLPVLDGLNHVVHKIVLHSQVELTPPVRLVEDGLPGGLRGPVLWAWNKDCKFLRSTWPGGEIVEIWVWAVDE